MAAKSTTLREKKGAGLVPVGVSSAPHLGNGGGVLLVGREAREAGRELEAAGMPEAQFADSILEALLTLGEGPECTMVVGVGAELEHLESAVRSLRRVNRGGRIVLLCEPVDEAWCRKALAWGADDYEIVPVDRASVKRMLNGSSRRVEAPIIAENRLAKPRIAEVTASLPLAVQSELLAELHETTRADFEQRAVGALRHLGVAGEWRYYSEKQSPPPLMASELRCEVLLPDRPLGVLCYRGVEGSDSLLAEAAKWLAGMLELSMRVEQLRSLAVTDELSGAYNRRYFLKYMSGALEIARDNRSRVTLLLFDIDDFKKYNDTFGHASGDAIIRELIKLLRKCTRPSDCVARVGGDEFAVVFRDNEAPRKPNSEHPKEIHRATERFRTAIRNHQWPETCNIKGTISISGGLATFPWDADSVEQLMAKADEALLKAKAAGKNVILIHGANGMTDKPSSDKP